MQHQKDESFNDTGLIVAAAGSGSRFGGKENKLLQDLSGLPVICHTLKNLLHNIDPENSILLVPPGLEEDFRQVISQINKEESITVLPGGACRSETVLKGLRTLPPNVKIAAIQDGARPFTSAALLYKCVVSAREKGSGVAARRVTDTIKRATNEGCVIDTPDRATLWAAETPQVFQRNLIQQAYETATANQLAVTDDAQVLEAAGHKVYLVEHNENNRKITYKQDLVSQQ